MRCIQTQAYNNIRKISQILETDGFAAMSKEMDNVNVILEKYKNNADQLFALFFENENITSQQFRNQMNTISDEMLRDVSLIINDVKTFVNNFAESHPTEMR